MKSILEGIKDSDLDNKSKLENLINSHSVMMKKGESSTNPDLEEILKVAVDIRVKDPAWSTKPWANKLVGLENTVGFLKNPEAWARPIEIP
jgi:hypothetical protein